MSGSQYFDIIILGGGPAGTSAALRLLKLKYRVAIIEQCSFPRTQIGESLSPGIWNILSYLEADHLLHDNTYLHHLGASVIWESREVNIIHGKHRGPGITVDRGKFDQDLLQLAVARGVHLYQPAKFESGKQNGQCWELAITLADGKAIIQGTIILDARGRSGTIRKDRVLTGPALLSIWTHISASLMPRETIIEAHKEGWLWGAPMTDGQFRVMAFVDPIQLKQQNPAILLSYLLQETNLFKAARTYFDKRMIQSCTVLPYAHINPWQDNFIKLGEAAFTLDPLSSTGVEKAMRFSLQTVVAINTMFKTGSVQIAQSFYEDRMSESVATHTHWTQQYYGKAWPGNDHSFWKCRSLPHSIHTEKETVFYKKLTGQLSKPTLIKQPEKDTRIDVREFLYHQWDKKVNLSPLVSYILTPCVTGDIVEMKQAVTHHKQERAIVYIDGVDIVSMLSLADSSETVGQLFSKWREIYPPDKVAKIMVYFLHEEYLV